MRKSTVCLFAIGCSVLATSQLARAQDPPPRDDPPPRERGGDAGGARLVSRLMSFDKDKDGKLTKDEVTDQRLTRLFDRGDTDKDGTLSKEELTALSASIDKEGGGQPRGGRDGMRGPGGPGAGGPDGPGRPGGRFGPPRPGQIMPPPVREMLNLSPEQEKQVDALQKEVDENLKKILTDDQRKQLDEMRERRRGGPGGPPGGRGGPRGPEGRPDERPDDAPPPPPPPPAQ